MKLGSTVLLAASVACAQQAAWVDPNTATPAGTRYGKFFSKTLKGEASYLIYLPPDYETSGDRRYPAVYWLHGLGGNQRTGQTFVGLADAAIRGGTAPPMIIVLVNGMNNSMYCDSQDGAKPVEKVIIRDLIPHVDATCRTIADRKGRAIEGYSMGGFGAARLGFKYLELFSAVSVMAGALHNEESLPERRKAIFEEIFGGSKDYYRAHSPWTIAEQNAGRVPAGTKVRVGVGEQDQLLDWNRQFHELMTKLGVENEFFVVPGVGHNGGQFYRLLGDRIWTFYREAFGGK